MIAGDRPRLNGGIRFVDSARHRSYVDARAYRRYLATVRGRVGWSDLTPGMFDRQRVTPIGSGTESSEAGQPPSEGMAIRLTTRPRPASRP